MSVKMGIRSWRVPLELTSSDRQRHASPCLLCLPVLCGPHSKQCLRPTLFIFLRFTSAASTSLELRSSSSSSSNSLLLKTAYFVDYYEEEAPACIMQVGALICINTFKSEHKSTHKCCKITIFAEYFRPHSTNILRKNKACRSNNGHISPST